MHTKFKHFLYDCALFAAFLACVVYPGLRLMALLLAAVGAA